MAKISHAGDAICRTVWIKQILFRRAPPGVKSLTQCSCYGKFIFVAAMGTYNRARLTWKAVLASGAGL